MAFEQVESVWPVHGSVLVEGDTAYTIAGRSNFLDDGLRFLKLDIPTGKKLVETVIDEIDPETGQNIQDRIETLQMPVGLSDILSSDGNYVFMRSQKFFRDGTRAEIGPNSGDPAKNAAVQAGTGTHLFAPFGFTDDSWFHRSYWVFGQSFSGGHNGYYQAAKYAPSGRILVADSKDVFGFGRKPEYLRWTTPLEHQLFGAPKEPPAIDPSKQGVGGGGPAVAMIRFEKTPEPGPDRQAAGGRGVRPGRRPQRRRPGPRRPGRGVRPVRHRRPARLRRPRRRQARNGHRQEVGPRRVGPPGRRADRGQAPEALHRRRTGRRIRRRPPS